MKIYSDKQIIYLSYFILLVALFAILKLNLFACFFAGFLIYEIVNLLEPLINRFHKGSGEKIITTFLVAAVLVVLLAAGISALIIYVFNSFDDINNLQEYARLVIVNLHKSFAPYLPSSLTIDENTLHRYLFEWLKNNLSTLQSLGKDTARLFTNIVIGLILGLFISVHKLISNDSQAILKFHLLLRIKILATAFSNIVFAQVKISAINTLFTGIFLLIIFPLFNVHLPLVKTLVLITFVVGLLPVIGNLISNSIIFVVGFSLSPLVAIVVLGYLIVIHKLEYFLNAKIIGSKIQSSAWELLIAMFVMQVIFGIAGVIAAPIYYAYIKSELRLLNLI